MHVYTLYAIAHVHDIFLRIYNYSTITAKFIFTARRLDLNQSIFKQILKEIFHIIKAFNTA